MKRPAHVYCTLCSENNYDPSELCDNTGGKIEIKFPNRLIHVLDTTVLNRAMNSDKSQKSQHNECRQLAITNLVDVSIYV